jgi:putative flippase GtrA
MVRKAASFAAVGAVNTVIDAGVFFLALTTITQSLVLANVLAWFVAVSCSYVMNSFFTFAAESGRQLRRRDYLRFVASGIAGVVANTATLVIAAQFLPVWAAKGLAILVSFIVNFSLSHFVVFRAQANSLARHPGRSEAESRDLGTSNLEEQGHVPGSRVSPDKGRARPG